MALITELLKANEDQNSDASESISLGGAREPPLSPGMPKLSRSLLKRQDSDKAHSFTSTCSTMASPMGFGMDSESVMSPESRGSSASPDSEVRLRYCREAELNTASVLERARQAAVPGSCKDLPPVPGYLAPDITPPDVPPPPVMPPSTSEFGLSGWKAAAHQLHLGVPASPSFRSVVGLGNESGAMSGEHPLIQPHGLLSMQYSTGSPTCNPPSEYNEDVSKVLAVLDLLRTGPSVPPLPPSGCYGGVFVSSAISEGLGVEAAGAAEAAAREFGERPVKVMLPWYPAHAGIALFDKTKPAKIATTF